MANQMLFVLACCTLYAVVAAAEFPMCNLPQDEVLCGCTRHMDPVCGRDGKWYNNACELKCANVLWNYKACCPADTFPGSVFTGFLLTATDNSTSYDDEAKEKKCKKPVSENVCPCTRQYDPVCGTDDKWYNNLCDLECAKNVKATADYCCSEPKPGSQFPMLGF